MKMRKELIFAAAALMLAACSNDESMDNWNGEIRLSSNLSVQQVGTRAATNIQGSQFDQNQNIDVYIHEDVAGTATTTYPQPSVYITGDAVSVGSGITMSCKSGQQYYPTSGNGVTIYALYPSSSETFDEGTGYATSNSTTTFTVQADQSDDGKYKLSDLMYGKPANNPVTRTSSPIALTFNHLLSKVTITLKQGNGSPDLDGAVVSLLSVKPTITLTADATSGSVSAATGTDKEITVMTASATSMTGSAIVPPQSFEANSQYIKVKLTTGGELFYTLPDAITLKGGKEYKYEITANLTGLTLYSQEIVDWAVDETYSGGTGNATMN